ncbi:TPM domain-containing protein [Niallia nealsonii]|uniref:TPM domain-containing protein n=1 Tax=Niallia nealsonii TaxID=115979 RepID=A0A2N0Z7M9_9BACI|nr:TPM domain-containing protein [Niallia nealsonii]PKG25483.1 hypothetical protein CWS01_01165 [Niallia nealsonii]
MTAKLFSAFCACVFFLFACGSTFAAENAIPKPVGDIYVQDFAHLLSDDQKQELNQLGRTLEDKTTAQVAVLSVQTTGEKTIQEYANEAFRTYGIGDKQKNNGVLLVVAIKDRKVRLEVGYGLEGRIPDGKAGRILDEYALPYLQNEKPNKALIETYKVLVKEVYGEYGIEAPEGLAADKPVQQGTETGFPMWIIIIIVVVLLFLDFKFFGGTITYAILSILSRGGRGGGGGYGGGPRSGGGGSSGGGGAGRSW